MIRGQLQQFFNIVKGQIIFPISVKKPQGTKSVELRVMFSKVKEFLSVEYNSPLQVEQKNRKYL